jgi:methyl-accepting chemotaxis protein
MFEQMKIKTRILAILTVLAGGYIVLLSMVQWSSTATHTHMSQLSTSLFPSALRLQEAQAAFERMKKHYGDAVVLQDAKALDGADKDAGEVADKLEAIKTLTASSPALSAKAGALVEEFATLRDQDKKVYAAVLAAKDGPSEDLMAQVGNLGKANQALADAMTGLNKDVAADFQHRLEAVDSWSLRSKVTGFVMFVFAVLACCVAWWVIQKKVVYPLWLLSARIQDIAEGEGDLTRRVEVHGRNEIDEVAIWFNVFLDNLQDVMRQVKANTLLLAEASAGLTTSTMHLASGADAQQGQTGMVATAMTEMAATVAEVSHNSSSAANKTRQAAEDARLGGAVVGQTVELMQKLAQSVDRIAAQISSLGERSDQIGHVINVIEDIANRTNLLALNATIEAARAGEQGRGFAVVAGEVRNLAENTTKATREIAEMIGAIQQETKAAVEAMSQGTVEMKKGVEATGEAGAKLRLIIGSAEEAAAMVNQIAVAATEQASTTDEVNNNVSVIARISNEAADEARQSATSCEAMSALAAELSALISRFKVEEGSDRSGDRSDSAGAAYAALPVATGARHAVAAAR